MLNGFFSRAEKHFNVVHLLIFWRFVAFTEYVHKEEFTKCNHEERISAEGL